jgi:hypothetical protein
MVYVCVMYKPPVESLGLHVVYNCNKMKTTHVPEHVVLVKSVNKNSYPSV